MAASALVLTVLFLSGAFLVAAPAYVFGGRADHAAMALLLYAMAAIGLIEFLPGASMAGLSEPRHAEALGVVALPDVVAAIPTTE